MAKDFTETNPVSVKPALGIIPSGMDSKTEIVGMRGRKAKTWDLDGNKRRLRTGIRDIHYKDNPSDSQEAWKEIDLTLQPDRTCHTAPYDIQVFDDKVGFSFVPKTGGRIDIELQEIGGTTVDNGRFSITQNANQLFWNNVADDIDIKVLLRPQRAELYKQIRTITGAKSFKWKIIKWHDSDNYDFKRTLSGIDGSVIAGRLEINVQTGSPEKLADRDEYIFEEEWTGRVSRIINLETRIKEWKTDPVYPVIVDAVVGAIVADADDGWERNDSSWINTYYIQVRGAGTNRAGLRFATVSIPQGATITTAKIVLDNRYCTNAGTDVGKVYFSNIDNAAAPFTDNDRPSQMTDIVPAGGDAWTPNTTGGGTDSAFCTSGIQSVVSRGGWSSGNGMRCRIDGGTITINQFWDYQQTGQNPAQLDVVYAVGAVGVNVPIGMMHRKIMKNLLVR